MFSIPSATYSWDSFVYWWKMPQECCRSLKKNSKMITQLQEYSVILKNVFPFFLFGTLTLKFLDEKWHGATHTKMAVSKESVLPWIGLRSWKGDFWSKITVLRFWVFCSPQKYLYQERTVNKSQPLKCTFIMSEKSIQNAFPARFKLKHSKQVPCYQPIHVPGISSLL